MGKLFQFSLMITILSYSLSQLQTEKFIGCGCNLPDPADPTKTITIDDCEKVVDNTCANYDPSQQGYCCSSSTDCTDLTSFSDDVKAGFKEAICLKERQAFNCTLLIQPSFVMDIVNACLVVEQGTIDNLEISVCSFYYRSDTGFTGIIGMRLVNNTIPMCITTWVDNNNAISCSDNYCLDSQQKCLSIMNQQNIYNSFNIIGAQNSLCLSGDMSSTIENECFTNALEVCYDKVSEVCYNLKTNQVSLTAPQVIKKE